MYYNYPWNRTFHTNTARAPSNTLKVTGEGIVTVQPNRAIVTLGVVTESPNLQEAQRNNAERSNNVIQALLSAGIKRDNIKTTTYRIDLNYDYKDGEQIFRGYRVTNMIEVIIDDIKEVGKIIDLAVENGANSVTNINMTVRNKEMYYDQALSKAVENAQHKARQIGDTLGVSVNQIPYKVKEITERQNDRPREMVLGISTDSAATPIEPGLMEIKAIVEASFYY
jgi:uncharacterized protein